MSKGNAKSLCIAAGYSVLYLNGISLGPGPGFYWDNPKADIAHGPFRSAAEAWRECAKENRLDRAERTLH